MTYTTGVTTVPGYDLHMVGFSLDAYVAEMQARMRLYTEREEEKADAHRKAVEEALQRNADAARVIAPNIRAPE